MLYNYHHNINKRNRIQKQTQKDETSRQFYFVTTHGNYMQAAHYKP